MAIRRAIPSVRALASAASHARARTLPLTRAVLPRTMATAAAAHAPITNAGGNAMACYQCEQTSSEGFAGEGGRGCSSIGVCGKTPEVAHLQDAMVHILKGVSAAALAAREVGVVDPELDRDVLTHTFSTLTNVNFDPEYFAREIPAVIRRRDALIAKYKEACKAKGVAPAKLPEVSSLQPASMDRETLETLGRDNGVLERRAVIGAEPAALQEMIMYGIKGTCAYAAHAMEAGMETDEIYRRIHGHYEVLARNETDMGKLVAEALAVGHTNVQVMAALDAAHNKKFGAPTPTMVNHSPVKGKCILISGHDLVDLEALLKQTEGTGINVYTHGEMLPAHGYPELKKYKHLAGNFGSAWQLQKMEFPSFPGPICMSTNCISEPRKSYKDRIFTLNSTGWPGVTHIKDRDFSAVIKKALEMSGFPETKPAKMHMTGFGHNAVLGVAPAVIDAVKTGKLQRFVLIGGCDGSESERSYYTQLAQKLPDESVILTLGCAKYRLLGKKEYGVVPGTEIPRLLDMGQCNDAYSAVVVAMELAKAFGVKSVNDLPLSLTLSWLEQKAVAVLLSLLALGVKNIRIGPQLPAFVTPSTLAFLQKEFNLMPIGKADDAEVASVMGRA